VINSRQKSSATFRPFLDKSAINSAADFSGRLVFYGATFVFCGRNICQLATLINTIKQCQIPAHRRMIFCFIAFTNIFAKAENIVSKLYSNFTARENNRFKILESISRIMNNRVIHVRNPKTYGFQSQNMDKTKQNIMRPLTVRKMSCINRRLNRQSLM
jgi:hypothetical protein